MSVREFIGVGTAGLFISIGAAQVWAQAQSVPSDSTTPVTLVGCLMKESDYRAAHGLGKGGVGGARTGSDFVLVDTKVVSQGAPASVPAVSAGGSCAEQGTGPAYRMAGKPEGKLKPYVGHYLEITGRFEHAHDARAATGQASAHLPPEIVIASYREATAAVTETTTAATTPPPAPSQAPPATTAPPAPAPSAPPSTAATSGTAPSTTAPKAMPKTASNQPLMLLLGALSLIGALGLRFLRRAF